jgi:ATP-dependent RNA helicase RhlE
LADERYETPTPIQAKALPVGLQGRDVLGCAQTGTGKTAAFALPILNRLGRKNRKSISCRPYVLVLAPTRELAIQIDASFSTYGRHLRLRQALVYGGVGQGNQVRALRKGAHIVVATPGRLLDLMGQGHICLDKLSVFVLDEADRMLDMGFLPDLKRIIHQLPAERQSLFFSATLPPPIVELAGDLLTDPVRLDVKPESTTSADEIEQQVLFVERGAKQRVVTQLLDTPGVDRVIVFTKTKRTANVVAERLARSGVKATAIHGNKSQNARQRALEGFRQNRVRVLVATDLAARGIDIDGVTHVINFDIPLEPEAYIHRIGRTGRAGAAGTALSLCSRGERRDLLAIERLLGCDLPVAEGFGPEQDAGGEDRGGRPGPSKKRPRRRRNVNKRSSQDSESPPSPRSEASPTKRKRTRRAKSRRLPKSRQAL